MGSNQHTAGVILAGGQSRRMGRDKALLAIDGVTLMERTRLLLETSGFTPVITVGNRPGALPDYQPGAGPLAGLCAALQHALAKGISALLAIPVDMPRLDTATLQTLTQRGRASSTIAHYHHHPLPLYCPVTPHTLAMCQQLLASDNPRQHALHVFTTNAGAVSVDADNATGKLDNVNTPDDWQRFMDHWQDTP